MALNGNASKGRPCSPAAPKGGYPLHAPVRETGRTPMRLTSPRCADPGPHSWDATADPDAPPDSRSRSRPSASRKGPLPAAAPGLFSGGASDARSPGRRCASSSRWTRRAAPEPERRGSTFRWSAWQTHRNGNTNPRSQAAARPCGTAHVSYGTQHLDGSRRRPAGSTIKRRGGRVTTKEFLHRWRGAIAVIVLFLIVATVTSGNRSSSPDTSVADKARYDNTLATCEQSTQFTLGYGAWVVAVNHCLAHAFGVSYADAKKIHDANSR